MTASAPRSWSAGDHRPEIAHLAGGAGIGKQRAEHLRGFEIVQWIADDDIEAEGPGARFDHTDGLRVGVAVDEEGVGRSLGDALGHRHGFGRGGAFVEQRRVGKRQAGQVDHHLLKD